MDSEKGKAFGEALERAGSIEALMEEMARSESDAFIDRKGVAESGPHPPEDQLYDYVLGSLSQPIATAIQGHISLCRECLIQVIHLRRLEEELVNDDLEWAETSTVLERLIRWFKDLVSTEPLDFEILNPAVSAATSIRGGSGIGAGLGVASPPNGILGSVLGAASSLGAILRKPRSKERGNRKDDSFKIGDPLLLSLSIPADGHLLVLHYDGADSLSLVFPNNSSDDTFVKTGETKRIPGHVEGPTGLQFLKAIWTTHPVIDPTGIDFVDQVSLEKALETCMEQLDKLKPDEWRAVLCEFKVSKD
jgi:hypothetical protein